MTTQKTNPWTFDVRVRERNLKAGSVTEKDVEKYLVALPDLADQAESFGTSQPALLQPVAELLDEGDEDEGEDDEEDEEDVEEAAVAPAVAAPAAAPDTSSNGVSTSVSTTDTPEVSSAE